MQMPPDPPRHVARTSSGLFILRIKVIVMIINKFNFTHINLFSNTFIFNVRPYFINVFINSYIFWNTIT